MTEHRGTRQPGSASATPQSTLGHWLIIVLGEAGGSATKPQALARIEYKFGYLLSPVDWHTQPSGKEIKWHNNTAWERNKLVKSGILAPVDESGRGVWRLTRRGTEEYRRLARALSPKKSRH
ncbi:winged helix-turn-helix domain-containing protein [Rhodococcoides corynebacterioides]|uniref:winged helix-turn-helix domain-containing protein n=1 Tax=Rhodococcoides corynebacterioides TaxID=53972 RepID=UPI001C9A530A|nr:hypothetical protein [Rhodococcus corynebacterioides]